MEEKRLEALLEQAIVDCYDEEEEFSGVLCTLEDNLSFPLQAEVMGEPVEVIGLDDLNFIAPDPTSAEWLTMYRYWVGMNEEA